MLPNRPSAINAEGDGDGARCQPAPGDAPLIEAATAHALRTRGLPLLRLSLVYGDGSELSIPVPIASPGATHGVPATIPFPAWPPPHGWAFRPGEAAFEGKRIRLTGKMLGILRELAAHPDERLTAKRLVETVWGEDYRVVGISNLQTHVSHLRRSLRKLLNLGPNWNPIEHADGAYWLVLPPTAEPVATRQAA